MPAIGGSFQGTVCTGLCPSHSTPTSPSLLLQWEFSSTMPTNRIGSMEGPVISGTALSFCISSIIKFLDWVLLQFRLWNRTPFPCWPHPQSLNPSHSHSLKPRYPGSCGGVPGRSQPWSHKALPTTTLHPVNIFLFICPSLHAQSYYLCTSSKRQPSGSPYKIYMGNVTSNDWSRQGNEGWEECKTAGCLKGIISYICAFPEVIIEWQWLGGKSIFEPRKGLLRKKSFCAGSM